MTQVHPRDERRAAYDAFIQAYPAYAETSVLDAGTPPCFEPKSLPRGRGPRGVRRAGEDRCSDEANGYAWIRTFSQVGRAHRTHPVSKQWKLGFSRE